MCISSVFCVWSGCGIHVGCGGCMRYVHVWCEWGMCGKCVRYGVCTCVVCAHMHVHTEERKKQQLYW